MPATELLPYLVRFTEGVRHDHTFLKHLNVPECSYHSHVQGLRRLPPVWKGMIGALKTVPRPRYSQHRGLLFMKMIKNDST